MSGNLLDLRSQLGFYKFYHHDSKNVLIHSIFVPTILFSSFCMLHRIKIYHDVSLTAPLSVLFFVFYCFLYLPTGLLAGIFLLLLNLALTNHKIHLSFKQELSLFVIGWIFQFVGHGVFEKKKPALFDNLVQSLVLAPYFIMFELLFKLGFMPQLKANLEHDLEIKQTKLGKQKQ
ncbi:YGL010W [Saccharomyces arboricola H-6]|uniref:YGL010W n=1 Tax=Saccharomyces arboricola (strain H-6 / AS 2.3317 / CBS 10644) TaxID=1160507 RepID=J8Q511_SACAR|nr:YGL010W [Saccharomyces arboricola H-6]